jgi:hypothetical protein
MVTWIIRAVDWGNIQRSPTFQAIFNYYFSDSNGLDLPIIFDSAGTRVDDIIQDFTPVTKKLDIIDAGIHYDVVKGENKRLAHDFLSKWHGKGETQIPDKEKLGVTNLYSRIKTDVHLEQMQFRNEALLEVGIPKEYLPGMRVPFRHNKNLKLILPIEENIALQVEDYYKSCNNKQPLTKVYGKLVGIDSLKDELIGGIETARKQVEYFMNTREKAMEEIIKLFE